MWHRLMNIMIFLPIFFAAFVHKDFGKTQFLFCLILFCFVLFYTTVDKDRVFAKILLHHTVMQNDLCIHILLVIHTK
jgi:hypothetical protein